MENNNAIEINNQKGSLLNNLDLQRRQNISKSDLFIFLQIYFEQLYFLYFFLLLRIKIIISIYNPKILIKFI